jgi:uncharacterized membrane-anchored protein
MRSKLFRLNKTDFLKGLLMVVITAFVTGLYELLQSGAFAFDWVTFKPIVMAAVAAGLSYLIKNFLTNSQGKFAKRELKSIKAL